MPRGDKSGPNGQGPMTGRAQGLCVGNDRPGFMEGRSGQGLGRGFRGGQNGGIGRGMRRRQHMQAFSPYAEDLPPTKEEERNYLGRQAERLKRSLSEVEKRLKDLGEE